MAEDGRVGAPRAMAEDGGVNEFSVCQFFKDGSYEYVRRFVSAEEAVKAVKHYTSNVAVKMGVTNRVIITDGGDCIAFEWLADKGVVFPPKEEVK